MATVLLADVAFGNFQSGLDVADLARFFNDALGALVKEVKDCKPATLLNIDPMKAFWPALPSGPPHEEMAFACGQSGLRALPTIQRPEGLSLHVRIALATGKTTNMNVCGRFQSYGGAWAVANRMMDLSCRAVIHALRPEDLAKYSEHCHSQRTRSPGEERQWRRLCSQVDQTSGAQQPLVHSMQRLDDASSL